MTRNVVALFSPKYINYDKMMTDMMTRTFKLANCAIFWIKSLYPHFVGRFFMLAHGEPFLLNRKLLFNRNAHVSLFFVIFFPSKYYSSMLRMYDFIYIITI